MVEVTKPTEYIAEVVKIMIEDAKLLLKERAIAQRPGLQEARADVDSHKTELDLVKAELAAIKAVQLSPAKQVTPSRVNVEKDQYSSLNDGYEEHRNPWLCARSE